MFKRKDIIRSMFLFSLIFTIMITLSQILVVHQHNHKDTKQRDVTKLKAVLNDLEQNIDMMLKKDALPLDKYVKAIQAIIYSARVSAIVESGRSNDGIREQYRGSLVNGGGNSLSDDRNGIREQHRGDSVNDPSADRISRILQNVDIIKQCNELKERTRQLSFTRMFSWENNFSTMKHLEQAKKCSKDIALNADGKVSVDDTSQSYHLKSHLMKGKSWSSYSHTFGKKKRNSGNRCPEIPAGLGPVKVDLNVSEIETGSVKYVDLQPGGAWQPRDCLSRHHVAIVIPYRDRWNHLRVLLHFLIPFLQRQQIHFRVFVVEQHGNGTFNKGRLMNAAFKEAWKMADFDCFIFHDVDLIPEDDRNMYTCPEQPRHMSPSVDKFNYVLPYKQLVGGVFSIRREHFIKVNGYSNLYWGWGAEDDDMYLRLNKVGLKLLRPAAYIGRYKMIRHAQRELAPAKWRQYLLKTVKNRFKWDGLNSVEYNVTFINNTALFTHIMVDIGKPPTEVPNISKMVH